MEDNNILEVEIFNGDDYILIEQICEALKNAGIEYLKTSKGTAINDFIKIYTGVDSNGYRIFVSKEDEKEAIKIVEDIINLRSAEVYSEEIPEELKDYDETYFEELAKKGIISSYKKDDGTEVKRIRKSEFIKKLKEEKNEILKDRKIIRYLYILIIPLVILEFIKYFYRHINDYSIQNIRYGIILIGIIPIIITILCINKKTTRMYRKFINNEEYNKTEKRISKIFITCAMIISVLCLAYSLDWVYTVVTGKKPIFSTQYDNNWNYGKCCNSIFYDYFSLNYGRKVIKGRNEQIPYVYELNYEDGTKIEYTRIEIIKNKLYIGIPSFLKEMSKTSKNGEVNPYLLSIYGIKQETEESYLSYVFSCIETGENVKDLEINDEINEFINFYKKTYKDRVTISKTYLEQIDNKNIGVIEYNVKLDNGRTDNHYVFFFEYEGKLIQCDFTITCDELITNNYLGENLIKTIEIYD